VTPKLLLDENISPSLAQRLNEAGFDAYHVRDRGMAGMADHTLWTRAFEEDRVLVTINARDFVRPAEQTGLHSGIITLPSGATPTEQFELLSEALEFLDTEARLGRDAVNRWIEIAADRSIRARDLPG